MPSFFLYLATVLVATLIPWPERRIADIFLSLRGWALFSSLMSFRIIARTAVEDFLPELLLRPLEKK